jgi:hypothetical protein
MDGMASYAQLGSQKILVILAGNAVIKSRWVDQIMTCSIGFDGPSTSPVRCMAEFGPPAVPITGMMLILRKWKTKSTNPVLAHFFGYGQRVAKCE